MGVALVDRIVGNKRGRFVIASSGIPFILPSSGTIGDNGALSALTALPTTYTSCYMYFPVNTIAAGVAAGWYYVVMASTTAGTIYNNVYTSGIPTIPASPTAFATTGPGAYTQTTSSDIASMVFTVPGGLLGTHGSINIQKDLYCINNANVKSVGTKFNATTMHSTTLTSVQMNFVQLSIKNRGVQNKQVITRNNTNIGGTSTSSNPGYQSIDTSVDFTITEIFNMATATDSIVNEGFTIEAITT